MHRHDAGLGRWLLVTMLGWAGGFNAIARGACGAVTVENASYGVPILDKAWPKCRAKAKGGKCRAKARVEYYTSISPTPTSHQPCHIVAARCIRLTSSIHHPPTTTIPQWPIRARFSKKRWSGQFYVPAYSTHHVATIVRVLPRDASNLQP